MRKPSDSPHLPYIPLPDYNWTFGGEEPRIGPFCQQQEGNGVDEFVAEPAEPPKEERQSASKSPSARPSTQLALDTESTDELSVLLATPVRIPRIQSSKQKLGLPPEPMCPPACYVSSVCKSVSQGNGQHDDADDEDGAMMNRASMPSDSSEPPFFLTGQQFKLISREERLRKMLREQGVPVLPLPTAATDDANANVNMCSLANTTTAPTKAHFVHIQNHRKFDTLKSLRSCQNCKICTQLDGDQNNQLSECDLFRAHHQRPFHSHCSSCCCACQWAFSMESPSAFVLFLLLAIPFFLGFWSIGTTAIFLPLFGPTSSTPEPAEIFSNRRSERSVELTGHKWRKGSLSWKLHGDNLAETDIYVTRNSLRRAFSLWEEAWPPLNFSESLDRGRRAAEADLNIHFLIGDHGDSLPFDGPEGMIAHAFYPPVGELHLDAEEEWTLNWPNGTNLFRTLLHEIGHLLGLGHSNSTSSVMFPRKRESTGSASELSAEDIKAIQQLYA